MKNLKRTFSFVLAIVMIFGVLGITTNAATDFTDNEQIQYQEAIEVLVGIGAINGYEDGSFKPNGLVTRAEAAKMVVYALLGQEAAERLVTYGAPYSDVPANHWAAKYIAYCNSQNILNGYDANSFGPSDNITGAQLAKMLLCAAGWGKMGEYTGSYWDINATTDANKYYVFLGSKASDMGAPATREECAQYIFNAVKYIPVPKFDKSAELYLDNPINKDSEVQVTIARNIGLKQTSTNNTDAFGRPQRIWCQDFDWNVISSVYPTAPVKTYTTTVSYTTLYNDIKDYSFAQDFKIIENGVEIAGIEYFKLATNSREAKSALSSGGLLDSIAESGNGTLVEVYADTISKEVTKIVIVSTYLAEVTTVTAKSAAFDNSSLTITLYGKNNAGTFEPVPNLSVTPSAVGYDDVFSSVKRGDFVLVTPGKNNTILSVALPEVVTGKMTSHSTYIFDVSLTVNNGSKYNYSKHDNRIATTTIAATPPETVGTPYTSKVTIQLNDFSSTFDYYIDTYGYLIGAKENIAGSDTTLDYLYVLETLGATPDIDSFGTSDFTAYAKAKVVFLNTGRQEIVNLPLRNNGKQWYGGTGVGGNLPLGYSDEIDLPSAFYSYTTNSAGQYILSNLNEKRGVQIDSGSIARNGTTGLTMTGCDLTGKYLNSSTVIRDYTSNGVTTRTGASNVPSYTVGSDTIPGAGGAQETISGILALYNSNNVISNIYVVARGTGDDIAFNTYAYLMSTGSSDTLGTWYTFAINGATQTKLLPAEEGTLTSGLTATGNVFLVNYIEGDNISIVENVKPGSSWMGIDPTGGYVFGDESFNWNTFAATYWTVKLLDKDYMIVENGLTGDSVVVNFNNDLEVYNMTAYGQVSSDTVSVGDAVIWVLDDLSYDGSGNADIVYIMAR